MRQVLMLPGEPFGPSQSPQLPTPQRSSRLMRFLVPVWLLAGLIFLATRFLIPSHPSAEPAGHTATSPITAISAEDLLRHIDTVNGRLVESASQLRRAQDQLARTLQVLERNYLLVEKHRLETAITITESVRRDLEQSRQETELISNSLKKEHQIQ